LRTKNAFAQNKQMQRSAGQGCQMVFFKPKIPIWVNFGGPEIEKCCYVLWPFGILCSFGTFFPVLVSCTKKNLATLVQDPIT
jgi:hypothetical protein